MGSDVPRSWHVYASRFEAALVDASRRRRSRIKAPESVGPEAPVFFESPCFSNLPSGDSCPALRIRSRPRDTRFPRSVARSPPYPSFRPRDVLSWHRRPATRETYSANISDRRSTVSILSDVFVFFPLVIKDRRSTDERRKISIVRATLLFLIKARVRGDGDLALGATVTCVATIPSRR